MKKTVLVILFLLFHVSVFSQENKSKRIDSISTLLPKLPDSISKVNLLNQLATLYSSDDNHKDSVGIYSLAAIRLSRKIDYPQGLALALYNLGKYNISKYSNNKHIDISKNGFAESTPCFLESLANYELVKDSLGIAKCYLQLGMTSYLLEYYDDAIKNLKISLSYHDLSTSRFMLGVSYIETGCFSDAKKYINTALEIYREKHEDDLINNCYIYLGKLYLKMNQTDSALSFLNTAIDYLKQKKDSNAISRPYAFIAAVYLKKNDLDKALFFAKRSFDITKKYPDRISLIVSSDVLNQVYAQKGDYKKAYIFNSIIRSVNDSFFNGSMKQKIADMRSSYDFKKKINDQKLLRMKDEQIAQQNIQKQKILRNSFIIGTILLFILLIGLYKRYAFKQKANLELQKRNEIILREKERSEELLLNILPQEVAEELKDKGSAAAKKFESVTVMFTDFQDFTKISEQLTPDELVAEIDWCYKAFDNIITKYDIEKIKTIGDSYMCAAGLPVVNYTHAIDIVNAAIEIQAFMQKHLEERILSGKDPFKIRIGIHTGPVVAGIVGHKKFAYDIWGDAVNIASRMESSGVAGKINISGDTYELVKEHFHCKHRGKIAAKNKGEVDMYFVLGKIES